MQDYVSTRIKLRWNLRLTPDYFNYVTLLLSFTFSNNFHNMCSKVLNFLTTTNFTANHGVIPLNDSNGIANSEDLDQMAPLGAV